MSRRHTIRFAAALLLVCLCALPALSGQLALPTGVDMMRQRSLEREMNATDEAQAARMADKQKMTVYIDLLGIGKDTEAQLLFTRQRSLTEDSADKVRDRFINKINSTGRFSAFDARNSQSGVEDQATIYVHGRILSTRQDIMDRLGVRKAVTMVTLGLQIKDSRDGKLLKTTNVIGVYGDEPGEGQLIPRDKNLKDPEVVNNLLNSYISALDWALELAAAFIEKTYRPMGIVLSADGDTIEMYGGEAHGIQPGDRFIIFRLEKIPGITRADLGKKVPLALVECSPSASTSTCRVIDKPFGASIKQLDLGVLHDTSLKLKAGM